MSMKNKKGDTIYRQDAIDAMEGLPKHFDKTDTLCLDYADVLAVLSEHLPSVDSERKKGKWIHGKEIAREYLSGELTHIEYEDYHCSECGYTVKNIRWNVDGELVDRYCSVCGADMRGDRNE